MCRASLGPSFCVEVDVGFDGAGVIVFGRVVAPDRFKQKIGLNACPGLPINVANRSLFAR